MDLGEKLKEVVSVEEMPKTIREAIYKLLIKLTSSRKSFYNLLGKIEAWVLILALANGMIKDNMIAPILLIYGVDTVRVLSYMGIIQYEKIKTEISIKK